MTAPWKPGDLIGATYQLRAAIGRGGMSTVWDAWDVELERAVAIKTVHDPVERNEVLRNEARALAAIRHPGLPAVHGLGEHRGERYLVLERLYGETLEHRVNHAGVRGVDLTEALRILIDVADVLHAVHAAGMAHHDVKPGNIMVCCEQRTVLLDFGIMLPEVRAAGAPATGTPGYLPPEVLLSSIEPGNARLIDVYAFGVVAFELLTCRSPFVGDVVSLAHQHAFTPPPDVATLRAGLPPAVGDVVRACLAKNAGDRPADMAAIADELRGCRRRAQSPTGRIRSAA